MTLSRSPQYKAFSRAVMDEKSLSPLFPVGGGQWLQMTGALPVDINNTCHTCLFQPLIYQCCCYIRVRKMEKLLKISV